MSTLTRPKRGLDQISEDLEQPPAKQTKLNGPTTRSALGDISNAQAKKNAGAITKPGVRTRSAAQNAQTLSVTPLVELDDEAEVSVTSTPTPTPRELIEHWAAQHAHNTDYSDHIFKHLLETELINRPDSAYMDVVQGDLSFSMRAILLDWLVEVVDEYNLQPQTFYLCVAYIDRYLSAVAIERNRLQLIGLSCMLIASKYWEIYPPTIDDFVHICDSTYRKNEILECEKTILLQLQYMLVVPTPWEFSRRLLACQVLPTEEIRTLAEYFMELTVQESYYMQYPPSMIAAASALLATLTASPAAKAHTVWTTMHENASGYTAASLYDCARRIHVTQVRVMRDVGRLIEGGNAGWKAVKDKYSHSQHGRAALIEPLDHVEL